MDFEPSTQAMQPKSLNSRREIALPAITVNALRDHLTKYPNSSGFVFATGDNTPFSPRNILRHLKGKLAEAGLPQSTRVHVLRHSVISWLLASGVPVKDVQKIAGHGQASTPLNIYGHILSGYTREAAKKIEGMFGTE